MTDLGRMIEDYYEGVDLPEGEDRPTGGSLHIVLDDRNVTDKDIWFCYGYAAALQDDAGVAIALALMPLSEAERRKVIG